jgi:hypothetical protein
MHAETDPVHIVQCAVLLEVLNGTKFCVVTELMFYLLTCPDQSSRLGRPITRRIEMKL